MTTVTNSLTTTIRTRSLISKLFLLLPSVLLILAGVLLFQSMEHPYWNMHLDAVQYEYRGGLDILVYIDEMKGKDPQFDELRELNNLNHYIGMRKLDEAAEFERSIAVPSLYAFISILGFIAVSRLIIPKRWSKFLWVLALAPLLFPAVFIGDLYYWLRDSGQNLDPTAPFSSSIHPFTPPVWGEGTVGQFHTVANLDAGFQLAFYASLCILLAMTIAAINHYITQRSRQETEGQNAN